MGYTIMSVSPDASILILNLTPFRVQDPWAQKIAAWNDFSCLKQYTEVMNLLIPSTVPGTLRLLHETQKAVAKAQIRVKGWHENIISLTLTIYCTCHMIATLLELVEVSGNTLANGMNTSEEVKHVSDREHSNLYYCSVLLAEVGSMV